MRRFWDDIVPGSKLDGGLSTSVLDLRVRFSI